MARRHNKKRNTAFLYEALVRELTKSIVKKDNNRKSTVITILKEHFNKKSLLYKELQLYKDAASTSELDPQYAEKFINYLKMEHEKIDQPGLSKEKGSVISKINKMLSKSVYTNFVPNYKNLATISQLFDDDVSVRNKILLENRVIDLLTSSKQNKEEMKPITNLAYKTFIENYNSKYGALLEEQKRLLNHYVTSFSNNNIELSIFLNEEIGRLREVLKLSLEMEEVKEDSQMIQSTTEVLKLIEGFSKVPINENMIKRVLGIQVLAREIQS
tara:strand:+ start:238 stop:1053 length:816 start_codon:yes stop_codon:yes gene_type:complete